MVRRIKPLLLGLAAVLILQICMFLAMLASYGMASDISTEFRSEAWEPCSWVLARDTDNIVQPRSSRVVTWWLCQYPVWRP